MPPIDPPLKSEHTEIQRSKSWDFYLPSTSLDDNRIPLPEFTYTPPTVPCPTFTSLFPDPILVLRASSTSILSLLQSAKDPPFTTVRFVLSSEPGGIARTQGNTITLFASYVDSYASTHSPGQTLDEILGVVTHELVHVFQHDGHGTMPGGLVEGIADWVRLRAGLAPPHWKKTAGGTWDAGYQRTAYFLEWVEGRTKGFVLALNGKAREKWDQGVFKELAGQDVEALWEEYQGTLKAASEKSDLPDKRSPVPLPPLWLFSEPPSWQPLLSSPPSIHPIPLPSFSYTPPTTPCPAFSFLLPDPLPLLRASSSFIFSLLHSAKDPPFTHVQLVLSSEPGGIAYTEGNTITLFASYVEAHAKNHTPEETLDEVVGVLTHELVHVYQHDGRGTLPGGLIEGVADWVRLRAGLAPPHWARRPGGKWDAGYERTAYFLDWADCRWAELVRRLNWRVKESYTHEVFRELTGKEVDVLWKEYQEMLEGEKEGGKGEKSVISRVLCGARCRSSST